MHVSMFLVLGKSIYNFKTQNNLIKIKINLVNPIVFRSKRSVLIIKYKRKL